MVQKMGIHLFSRFIALYLLLIAEKIIKTPFMADSITQGTLASWEKSKT